MVDLVTKNVYPVNSYGSGMAPLMTNLALWVGAFAFGQKDLQKFVNKRLEELQKDGTLAKLCDNTSYLLGADEKGKPERSRQCFEACAALHHKVLDWAARPRSTTSPTCTQAASRFSSVRVRACATPRLKTGPRICTT